MPTIDNYTIKIHPQKGRCVIAAKTFNTGDVVPKNIVIPFEWKDLPESNLDNYRMAWTDSEDCIALGAINLLNHDDNPNVEIVDDLQARTKTAVAIKDISLDDEITCSYKCEVWFPVSTK